MEPDDFLIGIPVFNEEAHLPELLPALMPWQKSVVFFNDGSTDNSEKLIKEAGYRIINYSENTGLSQIFAGMLKMARNEGRNRLITLDSDMQHPPEFIGEFLKKAETCSLVIGSRFSDISNVPDTKIASNYFAVMLTKSIFGLELPDVACGFRAFDVEKQLTIKYKTSRFGVIYEQLFSQILAKSAKIGFVKIPAIYHKSDFYFTQYEEVLGIMETALFFSNNEDIKKSYNRALLHENFNINLCGVNFSAFYCHGCGYQFSTDTVIAGKYFNSFI